MVASSASQGFSQYYELQVSRRLLLSSFKAGVGRRNRNQQYIDQSHLGKGSQQYADATVEVGDDYYDDIDDKDDDYNEDHDFCARWL
eukprot:scaffold450837_cov23-Prasinocladus_malaysianus.AAC.1